jgi:secretion/DNA translocation related TadE-like protein
MRRGGDQGAAIVWALALVWLILLVGLLAGAVAGQAVVRQRAATAADLSALAAAQAVGDGCAQAARVASANGASLVSCGFDGADAIVEVSRPSPAIVNRMLSLLGRVPVDVTAAARAGPPDPAG